MEHYRHNLFNSTPPGLRGRLDNATFYAYDHFYDDGPDADMLLPSFEDFDFTAIRRVYAIAYSMNLAFTIVLSCVNFVLFLTICCGNVRGKSPSWFTFHIIAILLLTGVVIHPMFSAGLHMTADYHTCLFLFFIQESFDFMIGANVLLLNLEIILTIILPLPKWQSRRLVRFAVTMCVSWVAIFLLVGLVVVNQHKEDTTSLVCIGGHGDWRAWQIIRFWIPAAFCFISATLAVVGYVHARVHGNVTYSQFTKETRQVKNRTEWVVFLGITNAIYIFLHVVPMEILLLLDGHVMSNLSIISVIRVTRYTMLVREISLFLIPLPFICVGDVRQGICGLLNKLICRRRQTNDVDQMITMQAVSGTEPAEA